MSKITFTALMLATITAGSHAMAHGYTAQPPLIGALATVGNHGSIAIVGAAVAAPRSLADVNVNVLNGAVRANVDIGQTTRHTDTLLGVSATVLDGGVGPHW